MATLKQIAEHLGFGVPEAGRHMKMLGINYVEVSMDEIRIAYLERLRKVAAQTMSEDGVDLVKERALTERVTRQIKELDLSERKGELIAVSQLKSTLRNSFLHIKTTMRGSASKIKTIVDARYGIDLDSEIIKVEIDNALSELSRYTTSDQ